MRVFFLFRSGTGVLSLLISLLLLLGRPVQNSLKLHRLESDRDEIWKECFSRKYASTPDFDLILSCSKNRLP